jgi:hypothetical protein
MKKIYPLLFLVLLSFSCSDADDIILKDNPQLRKPGRVINALDPTKLAKVVFYPESTSEKNYYFYPNGLLRKITNANGSLFQTFTYDSNNNLIYTQRSSTSQSYTYTFTYDGSSHITSVNGDAVAYDSIANQYIFHYPPVFPNDPDCPTCYDYTDRTEITLNNEMLIINERTFFLSSDGNYCYGGMFAGYNNGNMSYVSGATDPSGPSYSYDNKTNPLKFALSPICRALSVARGLNYYGRFATGENNSSNNVIFNGYGEGDPESEEFIVEYNANNLPFRTTRKSYYFQTLESTRIFALYYYQGDPIP